MVHLFINSYSFSKNTGCFCASTRESGNNGRHGSNARTDVLSVRLDGAADDRRRQERRQRPHGNRHGPDRPLHRGDQAGCVAAGNADRTHNRRGRRTAVGGDESLRGLHPCAGTHVLHHGDGPAVGSSFRDEARSAGLHRHRLAHCGALRLHARTHATSGADLRCQRCASCGHGPSRPAHQHSRLSYPHANPLQ